MDKSGMTYPDPEIYYQARRAERGRDALEARVANLELAMRQLIVLLEENGIQFPEQ